MIFSKTNLISALPTLATVAGTRVRPGSHLLSLAIRVASNMEKFKYKDAYGWASLSSWAFGTVALF